MASTNNTTGNTTGNSLNSSTDTKRSASKSPSSKSTAAGRKKSIIENGETELETFLNSGESPRREAVQLRAWEIWREEGCPEGRQLEHWLRAEKELGLKH